MFSIFFVRKTFFKDFHFGLREHYTLTCNVVKQKIPHIFENRVVKRMLLFFCNIRSSRLSSKIAIFILPWPASVATPSGMGKRIKATSNHRFKIVQATRWQTALVSKEETHSRGKCRQGSSVADRCHIVIQIYKKSMPGRKIHFQSGCSP